MNKTLTVVAATAALCAGAIPAAASTVILSPVAATASSTNSINNAIENTIDQSGLSISFTSGVDDFDAYFAQNPVHFAGATNEWFTEQGVTTATVTYDLGAIYDVSRFALWNEESVGFGSAAVSYSTDDSTFISLGSLSGTDHPIIAYPADLFDLDFTGRYFRMELSGCPQPNNPNTPSSRCAIGEVAFGVNDVSGVIPLPATLPLLLGALGLMGAVSARRRAT